MKDYYSSRSMKVCFSTVGLWQQNVLVSRQIWNLYTISVQSFTCLQNPTLHCKRRHVFMWDDLLIVLYDEYILATKLVWLLVVLANLNTSLKYSPIWNGQWFIIVSTMGPAYNEFGYNEHPAITSRFFSRKRKPLIDINVWKVYI